MAASICVVVGGVAELHLDADARQEVDEHLVGAAVGVLDRDDAVARREQREERVADRGHAGGEAGGRLRALQDAAPSPRTPRPSGWCCACRCGPGCARAPRPATRPRPRSRTRRCGRWAPACRGAPAPRPRPPAPQGSRAQGPAPRRPAVARRRSCDPPAALAASATGSTAPLVRPHSSARPERGGAGNS